MPMPTTFAAAADWIDELRTITTAQVAAIQTLHDAPQGNGTAWLAWDPRVIVHFVRRDGTTFDVDGEAAVATYIQRVASGDYHQVLAGHSLLAGAFAQLVNGLAELGLLSDDYRHEPVLQFARHLRNAFAHGGNFSFQRGEPKFSASFASITLEPQMNGAPLWSVVDGGDMMDLFDSLQAVLRRLASSRES